MTDDSLEWADSWPGAHEPETQRTIVVTISRDVKGVPLSTSAWKDFRAEVRAAVSNVCEDIYFVGAGTGTSTEWGSEDAFTVIASEPLNPQLFRAALARVGRYYGQEAVAVTVGSTEFI